MHYFSGISQLTLRYLVRLYILFFSEKMQARPYQAFWTWKYGLLHPLTAKKQLTANWFIFFTAVFSFLACVMFAVLLLVFFQTKNQILILTFDSFSLFKKKIIANSFF